MISLFCILLTGCKEKNNQGTEPLLDPTVVSDIASTTENDFEIIEQERDLPEEKKEDSPSERNADEVQETVHVTKDQNSDVKGEEFVDHNTEKESGTGMAGAGGENELDERE